MNTRAFLIAALLASPVWSQEPAAKPPAPVAAHFDVHSDAVRKIVRDTAASQYSTVRVSHEAPVATGPAEENLDPVPVRESPDQTPAPAPATEAQSSRVLSSLFDFLIAEALGNDQDDGVVTTSNEMLRCRIQKEQKTSPPGIDRCPSAD
jgi:hypothetical protein